jgi:branched-chain amino acid transport system substrate-binding protein
MALLVSPALGAENGPIKIGILNDQSGPYVAIDGPSSVDAARMAVEDFGGTVLGRKVEVVSADHQNKADIGATIARKMVRCRWRDRDHGCCGVVGGFRGAGARAGA